MQTSLYCSEAIPYLFSFFAGSIALIILYWVIRGILRYLRKKGDAYRDFEKEKPIRLSPKVAAIEQFLFFLSAIAGKEVFGFAAGGWLVFKGIHRWARWDSVPTNPADGDTPDNNYAERAKSKGLSLKHYKDALARNRFMIFLVGTGMSIAAGGLAGAVYHYFIKCFQLN